MSTITKARKHTPVVPCATAKDHALNGVFTTALEGGIGYWSVCTRYRWGIKGEDGRPTEARDFIAVIEDEEGTEYVIDRALISKGIRLASEGGRWNAYQTKALSDLRFGRWDDLDYDADTADFVVQYGLFGELVYG